MIIAAQPTLPVKVKRLHPDATLPTYGTDGAGGFDIRAIEVAEGGVEVTQDSPKVFRTGLSFEIPVGYGMLILSRSGHGFKSDIRLANCVGLIDSDYRGELMVKLTADGAPFTVLPNERIAQGILVQLPRVDFFEVENLSDTDRKDGGFGSTGRT